MNPLDRNGQISRCVVCDSKMHWAKDCPHGKTRKTQSTNVIESDSQQANDNGCEECELVLLAKEPVKFQIFVAEAAKSAVVDTACTKTVGGQLHWFNSYVDGLDEEQRKKVEIIESNTSVWVYCIQYMGLLAGPSFYSLTFMLGQSVIASHLHVRPIFTLLLMLMLVRPVYIPS